MEISNIIKANNPEAYYHSLADIRIQSARKAGLITAAEERLLSDYLTVKDSRDISPSVYYKTAHYLLRVRIETKLSNYQSCSTTEIQTAWNNIKYLQIKPNGMQQIHGTNQATAGTAAIYPATISKNTISDMQRVFKSFLFWLSDHKHNRNLDPRAIAQLKPVKQNTHTVTANDIIPADDLQKFFNHCTTVRDAALFRVLYSAALRIGEVCSLQMKDLYNIGDLSAAIANNETPGNIIFLQTAGKTGISRKIPITDRETQHALFAWLSSYPGQITPDSFVFVNNRGLALTTNAVSIQLRRIAVRAGLSKELHPHLLRHTRITELTRAGLSETHIKRIAWGHQDTRMIDVYSHLTPDDTAAELIKLQEDHKL